MRDIDDLLPQLLVYAPNCPEPLALRMLREAARELCHNAKVWRMADTMEITPPECIGLLTIADAEIVEIESARLNNHDLIPMQVSWLDANKVGWSTSTEQTGSSTWITQLNPNTITVYPHEAGTLESRFVLQPSLEAVTIPDHLIELYGVQIGRGAAARVLTMPTGDFVNPQLGSALYSEFRGSVASLKTEFTKGQQGARLRTRGNWF